MRKKGQAQLGETVAVIVIVIILLVVGIVFWNSLKRSDVQTVARQSEDLSIVELAKVVAELPELKCYNTNTITKVNCFDWYKILAFNRTLNSPSTPPTTRKQAFDMYSNYFQRSKITFQQAYPVEINVTVYDNNISANRALQIMIPVLLEKNLGQTSTKTFGWIIVEGYYR